MSTPTRDQLQQAFLAHRREHGIRETMKVVESFGGNLDSIPEAKWPDLIAALSDVPPEAKWADLMATAKKPPTSLAEIDTAAVWARFNKKPERQP